MSVKSTPKNGLTKAQISLFWRVFSAACRNLGLRGHEETEKYRKNLLLTETGKDSLKALDRTKDFDAVMRRLSVDSGDWQMAAAASIQDEKRLGYLIKVVCIQLMQLKGGDVAVAGDYLGGLLDRANVANGQYLSGEGYWLDLTFQQARKVFTMLDTHRRRLLRPWSPVSKFSPGIRYEVQGPVLIRQEVPAGYYEKIPFRINWKRCANEE